MEKVIKLSPSSLTFLYDECKRCFYLSMMCDFKRPSTPFPRIFSKIDSAMKDFYMGKSCKEISPELPEGKMIQAQKWVESIPMQFPNHSLQPYFRGLFDAIVQFDEGGYGLIDFKTSDSSAAQPIYQRQLGAYVYALENPAPGKLRLSPISKMGLVYYTPSELLPLDTKNLSLKGKVQWKEIERDDDFFRNFIDELLTILELPEPPEPDPECEFCNYRRMTRESDY